MTEPADFLAKLAESDPKAAERLRKAEMAVKGHSTRFATVWADDIEIKLDQPGLVDGLLASTAMTVVYGESGAGKTFVVIDLGCHVAAGLPWRGMAVEQGVVVYIAAESPESVQKRIWAWKQRHGVEHLPVLVVTSSVDLLNGDADELVTLVSQIRESRGRVALTIVDTLARAMAGNENAPEDMGKFVAACGRIREASGGHVLVVHHCGKNAALGARGHSSLRAATDVELEVTNGEAGGCIRVTKHRDEAGGTTYGFKLETVELGTNAKGRTVTTCVVAESEADGEVTKVTNAACRGANQRVTYEALQTALSDRGAPPPQARDIPPNVRVVTVAQWREAAMRYLPQEETKHKAQAFKRAMERLVAEREVRHVDGYVWLPGPAGHKGHTGHISPDVTECDRTESSGHKGHTVTHPFRGVTDVTVTNDGHERPIEGGENGLKELDHEREEAASSQSVARPDVTALFNRRHPKLMTLTTLGPDGSPQIWESRVFRLAAGQTEAGLEVNVCLYAGRGRRTERRFGPDVPVMIVEGHRHIPCPLRDGAPIAEVVNRLRSCRAKVLVDTFGEVPA